MRDKAVVGQAGRGACVVIDERGGAMSARNSPCSASSGPRTTSPAETVDLDSRRWWALPVILIESFLAFLDFFIVNIALPAMRDDSGARPAQLQFVIASERHREGVQCD